MVIVSLEIILRVSPGIYSVSKFPSFIAPKSGAIMSYPISSVFDKSGT